MRIDPTIPMDVDANGKDPDRYSYQLASYHQQLWSKPLPNGEFYQLHFKGRSKFSLVYQEEAERFVFTSDSIGSIINGRYFQGLRSPTIAEDQIRLNDKDYRVVNQSFPCCYFALTN